jgi:hypothetical protein
MNLLLTAFIMAALNVGGVYAGIYHLKLDYVPFLIFMLAFYIILGVVQKLVMSTFKPPHDMTGPEALHLFSSLLGDVGIVLVGNIVALSIVYNRFGFLKMLGFFATGYASGMISRAM